MKRFSGNTIMTIGQLAQESKTDAQTIRYYERQGLLVEPERTESNYRVYTHDAIERLTFIKRAKGIGFSLNDIKVLLGMADGKVRRCDDVREFAETRLAKIRSQIEHLKSMETILADLVGQCAVSKTLKNCPILFKSVQK
jgi:MerR family mercuric resistance operon transcriptional regulator